MSEVKYNDLSEGVPRVFVVSGPAGANGELIAFTPYQYEGRQQDQWSMNVHDQLSGSAVTLKLSKTMKAAVDSIAGQLGVGASFSLTKNGRQVAATFVGQQGGGGAPASAPPPVGTSSPPPNSTGFAPNGGMSTRAPGRYDKYSSPILSRSRMEAMAGWAAVAAVRAAESLGVESEDAKAKLFSTLVIMAQGCGIPEEFGRDRQGMVRLLNDEIRKFGVDGASVSTYICEEYSVSSTTDLSDDELALICDDIPTFMEGYGSWLAAQGGGAIA